MQPVYDGKATNASLETWTFFVEPFQSPSDKSCPTQSQQEASVALTYGGVSRLSAFTTTGGGLAWRQKTRQGQKEQRKTDVPTEEGHMLRAENGPR